MNADQLYRQICAKRSFLCVGLDSDPALLPNTVKNAKYPIFEFNKAIINHTVKYAVAYKPNLAFYEAEGASGVHQLEMTIDFLKREYPDVFIIADAKRGDIGNTAKRYARAFFEKMDCDAVTLAPYMGSDSVKPFLEYENKWAILLALTSNKSAEEFEQLGLDSGEPLYKRVITEAMKWGSENNLMFVVGATRPEKLAEIRAYCPDHFLLVPGVGAQGGTVAEVARYGLNSRCGLLVNSSRGIIFADSSSEYAMTAGIKARELAAEMSKFL